MESGEAFRYVRIRSYNPRKGFVVRRFHDGENLFEGGESPRWSKVTAARAEALAKRVQDGSDPECTTLLFEVATDEQRQAIDMDEELVRRAAVRPGTSAAAKPPPLDLTQARSAAVPPERDSLGDRTDVSAATFGR